MKYKVGDVLRIKDNGYSYTTYGDMFKQLGFRKTTLNGDLPNGSYVQVFATAIHHTIPDQELYACVNEDGDETLIGDQGLEWFKWKQAERYDVGGVVVEITESDIIINGVKQSRNGDKKSRTSGKKANEKARAC